MLAVLWALLGFDSEARFVRQTTRQPGPARSLIACDH